MNNPYDPPSTGQPNGGSGGQPRLSSCPSCRESDHEAVKFSWWGGMLGPRLFNHVKCRHCGTTFNSRTGRSNNTAIGVYLVVTLLITLGLGLAFLSLR